MIENERSLLEKLAKELSSLSPEDQIRVMEILVRSMVEKDPSLCKEVLLALGENMYPDRTDLDDWMEYRFLLDLARRVKERVWKGLTRREKAILQEIKNFKISEEEKLDKPEDFLCDSCQAGPSGGTPVLRETSCDGK